MRHCLLLAGLVVAFLLGRYHGYEIGYRDGRAAASKEATHYIDYIRGLYQKARKGGADEVGPKPETRFQSRRAGISL